ncbi:MAG: hypothetical protein JXR31_11455 [Prolixibacteraceae bacterium]|nr:hypothetical protein [Prolixibacteraceae bacterium]MBN2774859.1 hypothetical protein [Prolixibacteraceae bacterium]
MKNLLLTIIVIFPLTVFSQEAYMMEGRILDPLSNPVENAYIINFRNLSAYATNKKGQFSLPVMEGDSLIINHVSFLQKKIYARSARVYADIYLEYDTVQVPEIVVSPGPDKDSTALQNTMELIRSAGLTLYKRMDPSTNLVSQTMIENNAVLRSEASSISIVSFSPSSVVNKIKKKKTDIRKKRGFRFYKNENQMLRKEKRKAGN